MNSIAECLKRNGGIREAYETYEFNSTVIKFKKILEDELLGQHFTNLFRLFREHGDDILKGKEFNIIFEIIVRLNEMAVRLYNTNTNLAWLKRIKELMQSVVDEISDAKLMYELPQKFDSPSQQIPAALNRTHALLEDISNIFNKQFFEK